MRKDTDQIYKTIEDLLYSKATTYVESIKLQEAAKLLEKQPIQKTEK